MLAQYQAAIIKISCLGAFGINKYSPNLLMHKRLTVKANVIRGHFMKESSTSTWNLQATHPSSDAAHNTPLRKEQVLCVEVLFPPLSII